MMFWAQWFKLHQGLGACFMQRNSTKTKTIIEIMATVKEPPGTDSENSGVLSITETMSKARESIQ